MRVKRRLDERATGAAEGELSCSPPLVFCREGEEARPNPPRVCAQRGVPFALNRLGNGTFATTLTKAGRVKTRGPNGSELSFSKGYLARGATRLMDRVRDVRGGVRSRHGLSIL